MSTHRYISIFDTTLRDGEQAPGASLNRAEKLEIAHQLARLGVDIIEAGFPIASPDDFEAVRPIAREVKGPRIAGLARAIEKDIRVCWDAVKVAERPRIHTFISTSPVHMKYQIKKTPEEVLADTRTMVSLARDLASTHAGADVEFSAMDASRSEPEFLAEVLGVAVECGATTINVPDTVGYALPLEFGDFIRELCRLCPSLLDVCVSVHCHNDLGLATANSLAAVRAGATQVECAVNGIGERAGNASLEEVVMALRTRGDLFDCETRRRHRGDRAHQPPGQHAHRLRGPAQQGDRGPQRLRPRERHPPGRRAQGADAPSRSCTPADVGLTESDLVLGKHSGRHALRAKLAELGFHLSDDGAGRGLPALQGRRRQEEAGHGARPGGARQRGDPRAPGRLQPAQLRHAGGLGHHPDEPGRGRGARARSRRGKSFSNGSVESVFKAIDDAVGIEGSLADYQVRCHLGGQGLAGRGARGGRGRRRSFNGQAVSFDVMEASAKAYVRAVNNAAAAGEV